jgi:hypothetical protein
MYAALSGEVYLARADAGERYGSPEKRLLLADEGKDAPVMVRVRVEVEDADAGDAPNRVGYAQNSCLVSSFAEVRDGFI